MGEKQSLSLFLLFGFVWELSPHLLCSQQGKNLAVTTTSHPASHRHWSFWTLKDENYSFVRCPLLQKTEYPLYKNCYKYNYSSVSFHPFLFRREKPFKNPIWNSLASDVHRELYDFIIWNFGVLTNLSETFVTLTFEYLRWSTSCLVSLLYAVKVCFRPWLSLNVKTFCLRLMGVCNHFCMRTSTNCLHFINGNEKKNVRDWWWSNFWMNSVFRNGTV